MSEYSLYPCGRPLLSWPEPLRLAVLGATGSIGKQTLDLVADNPERLQVAALSCHTRIEDLARQVQALAKIQPEAPPPLVAVVEAGAHARAAEHPVLKDFLLPLTECLAQAVLAPTSVHCLVNGIVGAAGLAPTLAAASRGLRIALANKESLVVGGGLVTDAVFAGGAELLPVDSEHSAIAQCLSGRTEAEIAKLILTASGGPFRQTSAADLARVSLAEVLDHPTWKMGPKITVDSATLLNKGLEVIEAHHLFGTSYDNIEVVVHPGSIVHSLVEFVDGAVIAQLGTPDMRIPLQYAISGEKHWPLTADRLDLLAIGSLQFEAPDRARFPCLGLAVAAGRTGGSAPIVLNAANEVAVAALLAGRLCFADIPRVIEDSLTAMPVCTIEDLDTALSVDTEARRLAESHVARAESGTG